jgi:catechol 2,3-dioxygenase-like lactoylglutathione lyase family enzyme
MLPSFKRMRPWKFALLLTSLWIGPQLQAGAAPEHQPKRPRITGIDHVTVYVSDIGKSRHFYSDILGLMVDCPGSTGTGACFVVGPRNQRILLEAVPAQSPTNWVAEIGFATDNAREMRGYLQSRGFAPEDIRRDSDGAQHFAVRDPEGNSLAFVERPRSKTGYKPSSKQISTDLIHAGFVVKDMAAENRFYRDVLGFHLYWYGGFKDDTTDWYEIQVPDGPDWIEYMLNIPASADHKELGVQNHFSLGVRNVDAAAARLRANGLQSFDGPEVGRDGKDALDAYDPDGTRVEVMEFTPRQKPCCHPYSAEHPKP